MTAAAIAEVGGLTILAAVAFQLMMGLRALRARMNTQPAVEISEFRAAPEVIDTKPVAGSSGAETVMWMGKRKFRIAKRCYENEARDICSYYLVPLDGRALPAFRPGQFLTVDLPYAREEHNTTRCYSLSESPTEREHYRISVKRIGTPANAPAETPPGAASTYLHEVAAVGDVVETFAPAGDFFLDQSSPRPVVLIAGGVGLTPMLSMLNWLVETRSSRKVYLFYGVRNRSDHMMYDHLTRIRKSRPNVEMFIAYSQPTDKCQPGRDYNVEGRITAELLRSEIEEADPEFYLCGPSNMMTDVSRGLAMLGVDEHDIRREAFEALPAPSPDQPSKRPEREEAEDDESYEIRFARSGRVLRWTGEVETVLELAELNGLRMRCSCRQGVCGTCATALQEGSVDYVRNPVKEPEGDICLPCIARPRSNLVIDL